MRRSWWKVLSVILVAYAVIGGLLMPVPRQHIINETIRNLYFHVPMWFGMILLFTCAVVYAVKYLRSGNLEHDIYSAEFTKVGILFSILGMLTGMEWANYSWGEPWSNDPKQLGTAICMLIYFAYLILRGGMKDEEKRARLSSVYNVFAYALMIPLLWILPRMVDSLHPGNGGNPGFNSYDLDSKMRMVFYPAVIGWFLVGLWMTTLSIRLHLITHKRDNDFHTTNK
ncbi:cytochrome c biogenesis protein CcsA [Polluticoccus soli]|uniref:cytochrome c biogenesis protein CcsA n=1 Tax=Polluticoccus soli TaxID=3034150 RepID=UPI0023E2C56A|nr:cytochrome c biogenesis protein CcsA [Flavipsychrobacter sp. JY13-12]